MKTSEPTPDEPRAMLIGHFDLGHWPVIACARPVDAARARDWLLAAGGHLLPLSRVEFPGATFAFREEWVECVGVPQGVALDLAREMGCALVARGGFTGGMGGGPLGTVYYRPVEAVQG